MLANAGARPLASASFLMRRLEAETHMAVLARTNASAIPGVTRETQGARIAPRIQIDQCADLVMLRTGSERDRDRPEAFGES